MPNNLMRYTNGSIDEKTCKENERLINEDEADNTRAFRRQILASFLASLMSFSSGTVVAGWTPSATNRWPFGDGGDLALWSAEQESWIVSTYVIGALVGALPAGHLSQKYGRKAFLLYLSVPMTIGWIVCLLKLNSLWMEIIGRFVSGLSLGATTVAVPLYASDVSSDVLRGRAGVFLDFMLCAGIQYAYVARTTLSSLRQFCVACAAVPVAFAVLFSRMPESPVHLYNNGRPERAAAELRWLRGRRFNVKQEFVRMEQSKKEEKLSSGSDRRFLAHVWFLSFGLVLAQRMSGAGGVIQYSGVLFDMASATVDSNVSCIVVGAFQLAASGAALLLVDKVGRRTLLLVSSAIVTACLVLLAVYFNRLNTGSMDGHPLKTLTLLCVLCVFVVAFRLGLGPIPWFTAIELAPADRGGGRIQSAASSFSWFLSFVIMKTFKTFVQQYPVQLWIVFAGLSAAGFTFIALCVPETNNKSRQQIRANMTGRAYECIAC